jgi:hypothetical protein
VTIEETVAVLTPLALAMRADFDAPTFKAYQRILKDVPANLAQAALDDLTTNGLRFMPSASEILNASEKARRRLLALNPYEGCAECEFQRGFRNVLTPAGQKPVEACPCKARHLEKLGRMGLRDGIAMLPGEAGVGESEQVFPTVEQLPAAMRQKLLEAVRQKVLR